jgi:hypothetical protein
MPMMILEPTNIVPGWVILDHRFRPVDATGTTTDRIAVGALRAVIPTVELAEMWQKSPGKPSENLVMSGER